MIVAYTHAVRFVIAQRNVRDILSCTSTKVGIGRDPYIELL